MRSAATLDSDSLQTLHRVRSIYTAEPSARGRRRHTSSARSLPRVGSKPDVFRSGTSFHPLLAEARFYERAFGVREGPELSDVLGKSAPGKRVARLLHDLALEQLTIGEFLGVVEEMPSSRRSTASTPTASGSTTASPTRTTRCSPTSPRTRRSP